MRILSGSFKSWVTAAGCGVIAVAGSVAIGPAIAQKGTAGNALRVDSSCNSSNPCHAWKNGGAGPGIEGISVGGNGMVGQTTFFSTTKGAAGVSGVDLATPNPMGTPINNSGVNGQSATGSGVFGQTSSGIGVRALADAGTALVGNANGGDGVFGTTQSNIPGIASAGVFGEDVGSTSTASGVTGFSRTGIGVQGDNFEAGKYLNAAFLGLTFASSINTYFPALPPGGLFNSDIGEGVVAETSGSQAEALAAANFGGGPVMRGYSGRTEVMDIDNAGNMILAGKLTQHGHPGSVVHTAGAGDVVMYSPVQAVATVEDVGEARLTHGQTYVRLDPRFGATMNRAHPYLVFLTPQGDTSGLYVTQKTSTGFAVREHAGQSDIAFDYRIVGEPYASQPARLPGAPHLRTHAFTRSYTQHKEDLLLKRGLQIRR
jgi:hypothetical protein